ncbi:MAG: hypothetical protein CVT98_03615, partial [Bacteroidetes bacterium HGW-Bacteroidetes-15]
MLKHFSVFVFFTFFTIFPLIALAQGGLNAEVRLRMQKGTTDGSTVVIFKNGSRVGTIPIGRGGRFDVKLDYGADYILSFEKENYVTKKININTIVPSDFSQERDNIIPFDVELEPQTDLSALKVYDNPVGRIHFSSKIKYFDYDTDYSASFQKQVREEEKKVAEDARKKEIEDEKARIAKEAEQRKLAEEASKKAAEEARLAQIEKQKKEAEAIALAEAKAREEQRKKEEELKKQEAERIRLAEEARRKAEEEARIAEQERIKKEAEVRRLAEEARRKAEEEARI